MKKKNIKKLTREIIYKLINIFKLIPIKEGKIILINGHSNKINGNIKMISDEIKKQNIKYDVIIYTKEDIE
ncbi:CDP-glycerol--glycerophosphate glycerophosphotransferase, partial [Clostridium botulinum]|nr:CDP-glycerol--glycerophosphate glycerophosphotransferase [Clostridium botulinum]